MDNQTESQIQTKVLAWLKKTFPEAFVWKISDKWYVGIPDILFIWKGIVVFIELKRPGDSMTPKQVHTMNKIIEAGAYGFCATSLDEVKTKLAQLIRLVSMERNST